MSMVDFSFFDFTYPAFCYTGLLLRVIPKEIKKGDVFQDKYELQLVVNEVQRDDSIRSQFVNLSLRDEKLFGTYEDLQGAIIRVPVGSMKTKEGTTVFWALQNNLPELLKRPVSHETTKAAPVSHETTKAAPVLSNPQINKPN